jgi:hypothetical protein
MEANYAGGHSDTGLLEPLLRVAQVRVLQGENWAISLLTLTLQIQSKSQHTTSKPTKIPLQDASSPRQQAKQRILLLMSSYCTNKTIKSKRVAYRNQQFFLEADYNANKQYINDYGLFNV